LYGQLLDNFRIWHLNLKIDPPTDIAGVKALPTNLTLTCNELASQEVFIYVFDEAGNFDRTENFVFVQDNLESCAVISRGILTGNITNEEGLTIEQVAVNLTGDMESQQVTSNDGQYAFDLPLGKNYTVQPSKLEDPLNGVTTFDLILISKHILGIETFKSPYQYIAADINKSSSVTTADIVALRKVILGIDNSFPNNNTSWRFVDANYTFLNPGNPLAENFSESTIINLSQDADQDFVAIKVGDINDSAKESGAYSSNSSNESRNNAILAFATTDMELVAGTTYTIPFQGQGEQFITGYQFTIKDIHSLLELVRVNLFQPNEQGVSTIQSGTITASYHGPQYVQAKDLSFELTFTAQQNALLSDVLSFQSNPTPTEAYNELLEVMDIEFQFKTNPMLQVYQNQPNPFSEATTIGFELPVAGFVELSVTDLTGKQLLTTSNTYPSGYHAISINRSDLAATGVVYYHLKTVQGTITQKMVVLE